MLSHLITDGTYLVSFGGELVREPGAEVGREVERLVDHGAREVVLDLGDVTFVDATAVAALVEAGKHARRFGVVVTVVCDDVNVRRVLELVGVQRLFVMEETVSRAFAGVAERANAALPTVAA